MLQYDLTSSSGQQAFQKWVTEVIRNEINSYIRQVLFERNATNIVTPTTADTNPNTNTTYTQDEITNLRLDRLEQATFRR